MAKKTDKEVMTREEARLTREVADDARDMSEQFEEIATGHNNVAVMAALCIVLADLFAKETDLEVSEMLAEFNTCFVTLLNDKRAAAKQRKALS